MAVVGAIAIATISAFVFFQDLVNEPLRLTAVFLSVVILAVVVVADDIRSLEISPRLPLQTAAAAAVVAMLPADLRVIPELPW